jgi:sensor histidine kinase regulating citrate/malate metabolism
MGEVFLDTAKMLELLSVQRHDFLNHLQVISGLLQLNKGAAAREYIRTVAGGIADLSKVVHLTVPEVAATLLIAHNQAAGHQVDIDFDVQANLSGCPVPGDQLAALLEEILNNIIDSLAPPEVTNRKISINITGTPGDYACRITAEGVRLKLYVTNYNNHII